MNMLQHQLGEVYERQPGIYQRAAADNGPSVLCESTANPVMCWRVAAAGQNVRFRLTWGVNDTNVLEDLASPLVVTVPGKFRLDVSKVTPGVAADAGGNFTASGASHEHICRAVLPIPGAFPFELSRYTRRVTALATAGVSIGGTVVALTANQSVDVASPALLTAATGPVLVDYSP